jgi:hypothetical protein
MSLVQKITREGKFRVKPSQWTGNQCGDSTVSEFSFKVRIEGSELNDRGFVLDGQEPFEYFKKTYETDRKPVGSCEEIAIACVDHFKSVGNFHCINVTIKGNKWNTIEVEWRKE